MRRMNPSPFGHGAPRPGLDYPETPADLFPRSHPEDRQEGNFNPDPILECWNCVLPEDESGHPPGPAAHAPSGEAGDDDGAGNPSPRLEETRYGQDDADQGDLGAT